MKQFLWAYLIACLIGNSLCYKTTYSSQSSEYIGTYLQKSFGMATGGLIHLDYSVMPTNVSASFSSYALFLIVTEKQRTSWYDKISDSSLADNIDQYCTQPSMLRRRLFGNGTINFFLSNSIGHDRFTAIFLQCRKGTEENPTITHLSLQMKNAQPHSDEYSHMPIEEVMTVRVLEGEIIVYCLLLLGLIGQIYLAG